MSGKLVGEVLTCAPRDLTPAERLVLISLAESARDRTRVAAYDCSLVALADRTGLAEKTVKNALTGLKRAALISTTLGAAHRGKSQHYHLTPLAAHHRDVVTKKPKTAARTPELRLVEKG